MLRLGALLHDIGKIGVSDEILRKPEALTAEEFEQIKRHPSLGAQSCGRCRSSPRTCQSSSCTTSGQTAAAIRSASAAKTFRWRPHRPCRGRVRRHHERTRLPSRARHGNGHCRAQRHSGTDFDPQALNALLAVVPFASAALELTSAPAPMHQIA